MTITQKKVEAKNKLIFISLISQLGGIQTPPFYFFNLSNKEFSHSILDYSQIRFLQKNWRRVLQKIYTKCKMASKK